MLQIQTKNNITFNVRRQEKTKTKEKFAAVTLSLPEKKGPPRAWSDTGPTWGDFFSRSWYYPESLCQALTNTSSDNTFIQKALVAKKKKKAALIFGYLRKDVSKGWIVVTLGIQWPQFLWADRKNPSGQTIGSSKNMEPESHFSHFEETTLVSVPRVLNE